MKLSVILFLIVNCCTAISCDDYQGNLVLSTADNLPVFNVEIVLSFRIPQKKCESIPENEKTAFVKSWKDAVNDLANSLEETNVSLKYCFTLELMQL